MSVDKSRVKTSLNKLSYPTADAGAVETAAVFQAVGREFETDRLLIFPRGFRNQAEAQINHDVDESNRKLQKLKDEKRPEDEIKKTAEQLQIEIKAKVQALSQLIQSSTNAVAQERLRRVVAEVAKERGLDVVLDASGVYAGGQKINDNGVDVTGDVVKKLTVSSSAKSATK